MSRRLRIVANAPTIGHPRDSWQVLDAQTGEPIAGVYAVHLGGGLGDLASITLNIHAQDADVHLNWNGKPCSSPTDES